MVRSKREAEGYTQKGLADAIGLEYYTMISQIELGYISIPPALWEPLADKLKFQPSELAVLCLSEYQPEIFRALFGNQSRAETQRVLKALRKGLLTDEVLENLETP